MRRLIMRLFGKHEAVVEADDVPRRKTKHYRIEPDGIIVELPADAPDVYRPVKTFTGDERTDERL